MDARQAQDLAKHVSKLWEGEFPMTCRVIAAVPDDRRDYKPDAKSRSAWELAVHLAGGDIWFLNGIVAGKFASDPDAEKKLMAACPSVAKLVDFYKAEFPKKLEDVRALSGGDLTKPVDFFGMFQWPAVRFLGFANNHSVHHRGQLSSYLRAMGSKVPPIYGVSADERAGG